MKPSPPADSIECYRASALYGLGFYRASAHFRFDEITAIKETE